MFLPQRLALAVPSLWVFPPPDILLAFYLNSFQTLVMHFFYFKNEFFYDHVCHLGTTRKQRSRRKQKYERCKGGRTAVGRNRFQVGVQIGQRCQERGKNRGWGWEISRRKYSSENILGLGELQEQGLPRRRVLWGSGRSAVVATPQHAQVWLGGACEARGLDMTTAGDPEGMAATDGRFSLEERPESLPPRLSHYPTHRNSPATHSHTQLCSSWYFLSLGLLLSHLFVYYVPLPR